MIIIIMIQTNKCTLVDMNYLANKDASLVSNRDEIIIYIQLNKFALVSKNKLVNKILSLMIMIIIIDI